jgi:hypothetical protein
MYYSKSRKQWINPVEMHDIHLVNALARGVYSVNESDSIKDEILRRMAQELKLGGKPGAQYIDARGPVTITVGDVTITITR